jgi:hypothetical protein
MSLNFNSGKLLVWGHIGNILFYLQIANEPEKLECLLLADISSLVLQNTIAYWAQLFDLQSSNTYIFIKSVTFSKNWFLKTLEP